MSLRHPSGRIAALVGIAISATLSVALVTGCGSRATTAADVQNAKTDATSACKYLLTVGLTISDGNSVTSADARKALADAQQNSQKAADLDPRSWTPLNNDVTGIKTGLENNQRSELTNELNDVAQLCAPLVPTS